MYVPKHFNVEEAADLTGYIQHSSFAALVTSVDGCPYATHLPMSFDPNAGPFGTLYGHVARANDHWTHFSSSHETLAIFTGPHAYISPNWLRSPNAVPTWNYIAVHAYGLPTLIEDPDAVVSLLSQLSGTYENATTGNWTTDKMDPSVLRGMLKGIVAFEMPITRLEGKRKMSQNKSTDVQKSAAEGLREMGDPQSLAVAIEMDAG